MLKKNQMTREKILTKKGSITNNCYCLTGRRISFANLEKKNGIQINGLKPHVFPINCPKICFKP